MVKVKMHIQGMYNGRMFKAGEVVEFPEESLAGLDKKDYTLVDAEKPVDAQSESKEKQVEKSSDKMQRPKGKK